MNILFRLRLTGGKGRNRARMVIYNIDVNTKKMGGYGGKVGKFKSL